MTQKIKHLLLCFAFAFALAGCRSIESNSPDAQKTQSSPTPQISPAQTETAQTKYIVDVPTLANKPPLEFEKLFGKSTKITPIKDVPAEMPGEYRLYKIANNKKGLSVRFYKDRAVRFNFVLDEQVDSPRSALLNVFGIDVGEAIPAKTQFVERWQGEFGGIQYKTVYAMKDDIKSSKYKLVHAEIVQ